MFQGTYTAMVTPFRQDEIDWPRLDEQVDFQVRAGVAGLVPVGTTGESPTLSHEEHRQVIDRVIARARGRVRVIAGTGSNATSEALELTSHAAASGADASLQVCPYYNKPTQEGLYRHFMTLADGVDLPMILYNIPGRTGVTMTPQTVARLAKHPQIVGIKEATGSLDVASEIAATCGPKFTILSGDDSLTLPIMAIGGHGVISVVSNLIPRRVVRLVDAAAKGDWRRAQKLHLDLFPLCKVMFIETNPIPIKTAMMLCGRDTGELRLPMCPMGAGNAGKLERVLREQGVLGRGK